MKDPLVERLLHQETELHIRPRKPNQLIRIRYRGRLRVRTTSIDPQRLG